VEVRFGEQAGLLKSLQTDLQTNDAAQHGTTHH
jgi:hypothetical protein